MSIMRLAMVHPMAAGRGGGSAATQDGAAVRGRHQDRADRLAADLVVPDGLFIPVFLLLIVAELAVPVLAERGA